MDPVRDLKIIKEELVFKDMQICEKKLSELNKKNSKGNKEIIK